VSRLVWADECDGAAGAPPRADLWGLRRTDRWQPAGELQRYTDDPANAHHDGVGHLVLRAVRTSAGSTSAGYTSARLSARHSTNPGLFRYGLFAASIRVPTGAGAWPAWWLLGEDDRYGWPACGEIDIMEAPSAPATAAELVGAAPSQRSTAGQVHQGTHSPAAGSPVTADDREVAVGVPPSTGDWGGGFHVYALDWRPGRLTFSIDGRRTGEVTRAEVESRGGAWPFEERRQSPVINLAVGGWAGRPGDWTEQSMLVDWVRVYE
jgi:beta-glucanase (GH16 family)